MAKLILIFLLLFISSWAKAENNSLYWKLFIEGLDDPDIGIKHALEYVQGKPINVNDRNWLESYLYLAKSSPGSLTGELGDEKLLNKAREGAHSQKFVDLALQFSYLVELFELDAKKPTHVDWNLLYDKYLALAQEQKVYQFVADLASKKAYSAYNSGDMKAALQITQNAMQTLDKHLPFMNPSMILLRGDSAMFLEYSGDREKSMQIYRAVLDDLRALKVRFSLSDVSVNYGVALMNAKRYAEAQKIFRESQAIGVSLNSPLLEGRALKGVSFSQQKMQQYKAAIASYEQTITILKAAKEDPVAIADTYKLLAESYNYEKQYSKALKALETAESEPTAMMDKNWEKHLQIIRVEAYAGLGDVASALKYSKRVSTIIAELWEAESAQQLNKLKISMGLEIEEQKNQLLTEQNKLQHEKLEAAETIRRFFFGLLGLSVLVILLLGVALLQTLKVKKSRERVHRILEHIEEGILSIGMGMKVEADLSPYLAKLLGLPDRNPKSVDMFSGLLEAADLQSDERAIIRAALNASLGEDELNWELNLAQLPLEVTIQGGNKHLSLEWQPIYDDKQVRNVLITVRDITARRKLQNEVAHAKAHASRMEQRLSDILQIDARAAEAFVNEARRILPDLRPKLENNRDLPHCYRQLHTLKGMARSLGFKEMSSLVHAMEDQLDLDNKVLKQRDEAMHILGEIERTVNEYNEIIEKVFFRQSEAAGLQAISLVDLVATSILPVRSMLERAGLELAQINVQDHVQNWTREQLDVAQILLLHGMTNSADHGFILPRRKGSDVEKGAVLSIKAWRTTDNLHIELSDNGVGVDLAALAEVARRKGFVPKGDQTVADVVFEDGASTAEQVSTSSGRGMGLSALRNSIDDLSGSVHFKPNPTGRGSCLVARIPLSVSKAA